MRRPLCWMCLLMILGIVLLKNWEFSFLGKTPNSVFLADQKKNCTLFFEEKIKEQPDIQAVGIVERCSMSQNSQTIYLKKVRIMSSEKVFQVGKIKVILNTEEKIPIGSGLKIQGKIEKISGPGNPGEFDSRSYEACNQVYYLVKKGRIEEIFPVTGYEEYLQNIRNMCMKNLMSYAGEQAEIFGAMILGEKNFLEKETKTMYQMSGIVHILAISGLHLSMIGIGVFQLLKYMGLGNGGSGFFSVVFIYLYGVMTGGSVATFRAIIMMILVIGGKVLGRSYDLLTALSISAMLLLVDSPGQLWNSGFLLSFGAVLGVAIVYPILQKQFHIKKKAAALFLSSFCVQVVTLPIQSYFYYEFSIAGVFLNLIVIPTVSAVLVSGICGILLGFLWPSGAKAVLYPGKVVLVLYEKLCRFSLKLPFGIWVTGRPKIWKIVIYYGILSVLLLYMRYNYLEEKMELCKSKIRIKKSVWKKEKNNLWKNCAIMLFVYVSSIGLLGIPEKNVFSITCLDVGQGDGIVVTSESGKVFLCDGGSSSKKSVGTYQILPYLKYKGYSEIEGIFVTHTDADHINGVQEILEAQKKRLTSVRVKTLYLPSWKNPPEEYIELETLAKQAGVKVVFLYKGCILRDKKIAFHILSPEKGTISQNVNESGMVIDVQREKFHGLLTGDIGIETEEKLMFQDCDFLKVGHHGSCNSTGMNFLEKVCPEIAFISCSETNTYGHPSPETIERLKNVGANIFITKDSGAITLSVTDQGMRVHTFLKY